MEKGEDGYHEQILILKKSYKNVSWVPFRRGKEKFGKRLSTFTEIIKECSPI